MPVEEKYSMNPQKCVFSNVWKGRFRMILHGYLISENNWVFTYLLHGVKFKHKKVWWHEIRLLFRTKNQNLIVDSKWYYIVLIWYIDSFGLYQQKHMINSSSSNNKIFFDNHFLPQIHTTNPYQIVIIHRK